VTDWIGEAAAGHLPPWAEAGAPRQAHMARVAALMESWAQGLGLPEPEVLRWHAAGWLHDVLRDADPVSLLPWVPKGLHSLPPLAYHGPAASARLASEGVTDASLLAAIAGHTVGDPDADLLGCALFCADTLEPGRGDPGGWREPLRLLFPTDPDAVTRQVAAARIRRALEQGERIPETLLALWNGRVR